MRHLLLVLLALYSAACAQVGPHAETQSYAADGIHLRHLRVRVTPAQTQDFEALIERCVLAAQTVQLSDEHGWLCYRESPGRYWLVSFSETRDGFAIPSSDSPLRSFTRHIASLEGPEALAEIDERIGALEYEIEWSLLARQKHDWATAREMSTELHPKARVMLRSVRPGEERAFEQALAERTAFLAERDYPLPVEGFVVLSGAPGTAMQVVFPRDWPSFHAGESFWEFAQKLPESEREEYMRRKAALMRTMWKAEYYDASFLPEASFGGR